MKPVKKRRLPDFYCADRQFDREGRAILALADDYAANAYDAAFAGSHVALEVAVVMLAIGCWHQDLDVLPNHLGRLVAEQPLSGTGTRMTGRVLVDNDHRFRHGVENRLQGRLTRQRVV